MDDAQQPDGPSSAMGWDFGAVEAFKSVFRRAANAVHKQTVGRAQTALIGCGLDLSDDQVQKLLLHPLKIGESFLAPIPSEQMALSLNARSVERVVGECAVRLDNVSMQGAEVWLYNFATWEGPAAQIGSLSIGSLMVLGDGYKVMGSLTLKALKLRGGAALWIDVVVQVCVRALRTALAAKISPSPIKSGPGQPMAPVATEGLKARFIQGVQSVLAQALEAEAEIKIGSLELTVDSVQVDGGEGQGKLSVKDVTVGGKVAKGEVELGVPTGELMVNFSGEASRKIGGFDVSVKMRTSVGASLDLALASLESLVADFDIGGDLGGKAVAAKGTIRLANLTVKASTDGQELLDMIVEECGDALPKAYAVAVKAIAPGSADSAVSAALMSALTEAVKATVRDRFQGSVQATIGSLDVVIARLSYDSYSGEGSLDVSDVLVTAELSPGKKTQVDVEGDVSLHDVLVRTGGEQLISIIALDVHLDDQGTGEATAQFILKGKALAALAESTPMKLLMKSSDPLSFKVPVSAYKIALSGLELSMPKHKLINGALNKFVLDNIRVSNEEHASNLFRKTKKIEPTLKVSVGPKQMASLTGSDFGEKPGQVPADPVLIPRQALGTGGQGAVNLKAYLQNVVQNKLDVLLQ